MRLEFLVPGTRFVFFYEVKEMFLLLKIQNAPHRERRADRSDHLLPFSSQSGMVCPAEFSDCWDGGDQLFPDQILGNKKL